MIKSGKGPVKEFGHLLEFSLEKYLGRQILIFLAKKTEAFILKNIEKLIVRIEITSSIFNM